jgi:predicted RNA-binding Zn ribbon-like protein
MKRTTPETIQLWGGTLCLDFANTVDRDDDDRWLAPEATDVLLDPDMLARWGRRLALITSVHGPAVSGAELGRSRRLREALYATFAAIARNRAPASRDLELIRTTYVDALAQAGLAAQSGAWRPAWSERQPATVRFAVAADAMRLLADAGALARVTRCPGRHCGWLFINTSGRRRWCSMSACGSREKMRRMHARRRAVASETEPMSDASSSGG